MTTGVSLLMATVGRTRELARFIDHLKPQSSPSFELIVVDQNQDDRLAPIIADARATGIAVTHLRVASRGLSAARNAGLGSCRYSIVGIPDDDCWYEPSTIAEVLAGFAAHPSAAVLVGSWPEGDSDVAFPEQLDLAAARSFRAGPVDSLRLFFRTDVLREIQGFDERLGVPLWFGAAEETDAVLRLLARGHTLVRRREIRMHHPAKTPDEFTRVGELFRRVRSYERATGALYRKHRLSPWVTGRGLVAPFARAALAVAQPKRFTSELATALGRVEGFVCWR